MKKTQVAFQMSAERLAELGRMYFWTFTFAETLDIVETRRRWNRLLTQMRRRWPEMCGLRVFEMHKTHGLHVHLLTTRFIRVRELRVMTTRAGWGRINVKAIPLERASYLGKYLSKERPECLKRWRLWAAFGDGWQWTKVSDLEKDSAIARVYRLIAEEREWFGNKRFFRRMKTVQRLVERRVSAAGRVPTGGLSLRVHDAMCVGGRILIW